MVVEDGFKHLRSLPRPEHIVHSVDVSVIQKLVCGQVPEEPVPFGVLQIVRLTIGQQPTLI